MSAAAKPSKKQLRYLRDLAVQRGESFQYPRTCEEARAEIDRLLGRRRSTRAEQRGDREAVSCAMAQRGDAAAVRDSEIAGYGSSARWADSG